MTTTLSPPLFKVKYGYRKDFRTPKTIRSVSLDAGRHIQMFTVDFLKAHSFVIDGMEKNLIFPQFCRHKGDLKIQGFEVLDLFSMIRYLSDRFHHEGTTFIRQGDTAYDLKTRRKRKIMLGRCSTPDKKLDNCRFKDTI